MARAGHEPPPRSVARGPGAAWTGRLVLQRDRGGGWRSHGHGHVDALTRAWTISTRRDRSGETTAQPKASSALGDAERQELRQDAVPVW